jgi:hypothetical protein
MIELFVIFLFCVIGFLIYKFNSQKYPEPIECPKCPIPKKCPKPKVCPIPKECPPPDTSILNAPDYFIDNLYEITKFMNNFFHRHDIKYWLIGGSLIGALRNTPPGPIKWDDDIDVAIFKKDEAKLLYAMRTDDEFLANIEWTEHNFGYQLRIKGDDTSFKEYYYDIFIYEKRDGPYGVKWYTDVFPENYYNDGEILPLKECKFWDLTLYCPNDDNTVHRGYEKEGENVLQYGMKYNHKLGIEQKMDVWECVNHGDTVPMLSKKLAKKLQFV